MREVLSIGLFISSESLGSLKNGSLRLYNDEDLQNLQIGLTSDGPYKIQFSILLLDREQRSIYTPGGREETIMIPRTRNIYPPHLGSLSTRILRDYCKYIDIKITEVSNKVLLAGGIISGDIYTVGVVLTATEEVYLHKIPRDEITSNLQLPWNKILNTILRS